ncbi:unnamed protein product [Strongylus vulgaris]|uniref:G-protein coupled receptors family 1 profile domain-containing protein n=1 Tax=Strongylus vulgaris TaxID=40348 RepID=A0A3P7JVQ2_STRVU|nr:unnamed protein product [Strongylus vulgaris]
MLQFVLAVSVERLLIIKFPFRSLDNYNIKKVISNLNRRGKVFNFSYHHVSHTCLTFEVCSGNQIIGLCYENAIDSWGKRPNPTSALTKQWIEASIYLNAAFAVLLPVFAVAVLNISLVKLLKKRNTQELLVHSVNTNPSAMQDQERKMTHTVLAIITCFSLTQGPSAIVYLFQKLYPSIYLNAAFAVLLPVFAVAVLNISLVKLLKKRNTQELLVHSVNTNPSAMQDQERKMTHTVLAIITCFSLTQGPSAIVYLFQKLYRSNGLQIASVVANQLVLTGKMLNVVLFCMTSSTFRRKLLQICRRWIYTALYCDRKGGNRYRFSRSQSKSLVTQKTSLVYSPSAKCLGSSVVSEMYPKRPTTADNSSPKTSNEETV